MWPPPSSASSWIWFSINWGELRVAANLRVPASLYRAGEPCWLLEGVEPGGVVHGEPPPEFDPDVSDLRSEPWRLKPVPICEATEKIRKLKNIVHK